jgi:hypothetical protein
MKDKRQLAAKILNKKFGVLHVLEFSHIKKYKKFFKCECTRCNNFTVVRSDHLLKLPKSCGNCVNTLQKEIADKKYKKLRKYKTIFNYYKSNAKTRCIEFNLTLDDFIDYIDSNCYYCNDNKSKGIDRVDNSKGYSKNNCVSCCKFCNIMKNNYTLEEVLDKVNNIYNKHLK